MGGKEERDKRGGCGVSRGFVIVHRLRLFCGQGEKRVEEEANQRRDGKLVTGGGRGEEEADGKTRRGDRRRVFLMAAQKPAGCRGGTKTKNKHDVAVLAAEILSQLRCSGAL